MREKRELEECQQGEVGIRYPQFLKKFDGLSLYSKLLRIIGDHSVAFEGCLKVA